MENTNQIGNSQEMQLHKAQRMASVALSLTDNLHETGRAVPESLQKDLLRQINDLQSVIVELNSSLENLEVTDDSYHNEEKEKLYQSFITERYLKDCMQSFILEEGKSEKYFNEWRYYYAGQNIKEFANTKMFEEYIQAIERISNISALKSVIEKLETAEEFAIADGLKPRLEKLLQKEVSEVME